MAHGYSIVRAEDQDLTRAAFLHDVTCGLKSARRYIPSRWFYDDIGSKLFDAITRLDEYYPTRTELEILRSHAKDISNLCGEDHVDLIELGAGCSPKTLEILRQLIKDDRDFTYRPVDISEGAMRSLVQYVADKTENRVATKGVVADYMSGLAAIDREHVGGKRIILFLGSNIGNMNDAEAETFLLSIRTRMKSEDRLVVGFDLMKKISVLHAAYDDAKGITTAFNYNLLKRINRELGGDFNPDLFAHHPYYDPSLRAMVSNLVPLLDHTVTLSSVPGFKFEMREGQGIRTEMSRKYTRRDITDFARKAMFEVADVFTDQKMYFADAILAPI